MGRTIFIDPGRCIGCQACVSACRECDSHRGKSMIHLDYTDEGHSVASLDLASRIGCPSVRGGGAEAPPAHAPGAKAPRTGATEAETPGRRT